MADPFLGQIVQFGGNFAPRGWALCDGQLLPISQYSALFSLLGTIYGGDGRTTFALPDLRGRRAIHPGNGPGLSPYRLGEKGGRESTTLQSAHLPSHNHGVSVTVHASSGPGDTTSPQNAFAAEANDDVYSSSQDANMGAVTVNQQNVGGGQSFDHRDPYLCVNFIIALQGVFPSRS